MHARSLTTLLLCALLSAVAALPTTETLDKRTSITLPGSNSSIIDTGDDLGDLGDFSPIEDGFLEGDSDTGGGSDQIGEVDGAIANGLTSVGAVSGSTSKSGSGSTSSACSLTGCTSAAQSQNGNSTSQSTSSSSIIPSGSGSGTGGALISGPLVSGPLININNNKVANGKS